MGNEILLFDMRHFMAARGVKPSPFGEAAGVGRKFFQRVEAGRDVTQASEAKIYDYLASEKFPTMRTAREKHAAAGMEYEIGDPGYMALAALDMQELERRYLLALRAQAGGDAD